MPKPVIFTIDDDTAVLNSIERDLRAHYGQAYRVLPIDSGKAALDYLPQLDHPTEPAPLLLLPHPIPETPRPDFPPARLNAYPHPNPALLTPNPAPRPAL